MAMRFWLVLGAAAVAAGAARAEDAATGVDELVVVGSRAAPRAATQSASPVDVITRDDLKRRGFTDLTRILETLEPSFNFPPVASSPTAAGTRPATLRGLSPDQVLVLVNGKRRHAAAVINSNNGIGRGTVPVDLNAIPVSAIKRIEVLRDGAAAQYGSDAIAGVINIVLDDAPDGGEADARAGQTEKGDGTTVLAQASDGFRLGGDGFLRVSGDVRSHDFTNAAAVDPRFGRVTALLSEPKTLDLTFAANAEYGLPSARLYGFATADWRRSEMSPLFRTPTVSPSFYPQGFLPLVRQKGLDLGGAVGLRGRAQGWDWDLSDTAGFNRSRFRVSHTVNTSLGAASPTAFDGGGATYWQNLLNLTVSRSFALLAGANLALGVEHRHEAYRITPGEPLSFAGAGAQGFPGFNPPHPVDVDRDAVSAYADATLSPIAGLDLGLAGRYEHYSDFGSHTTGKASAYWRVVPALALRATASTGLRAPSFQQQYYSTVTSQLLPATGQLANVGNFAVTDPVARALGATPLKPEVSHDLSAGVVFTPFSRLAITADLYRIKIRDRIALSENLTGAPVTAILVAHGITNAAAVRFFTNAADTRTQGWEANAHYWTPVGEDGRLDVNLGYGAFDTDLTALRVNPVLPSLVLLGPQSIGVLSDGQPRNKVTLAVELALGPWRVTADGVRYGEYRAAPLGVDQVFGSVSTLDLSLARQIGGRLTVQGGVNNVTDQYTDHVIGATDGRIYTEAGGVGFEGRSYYLQLSTRF
jgi:iron complex outermembrane receptor protein